MIKENCHGKLSDYRTRIWGKILDYTNKLKIFSFKELLRTLNKEVQI